jgi:hypothetical protein
MCVKLYNIFSFLFVGLNLPRVMLEAAGITKNTWAHHVRQNRSKLDSGNAWAREGVHNLKVTDLFKTFFPCDT